MADFCLGAAENLKKVKHLLDLPKASTKKHAGLGIGQNQMEILDEDHNYHSHLVKQEVPAHQVPGVQLSINSEHDETEDSAVVIDEDNYDDEPNARKRNTEFGERVSTPPLKTVTEPKIVVQTRSEVDLLDDGFKWRKYGQKIVKGSSYPRGCFLPKDFLDLANKQHCAVHLEMKLSTCTPTQRTALEVIKVTKLVLFHVHAHGDDTLGIRYVLELRNSSKPAPKARNEEFPHPQDRIRWQGMFFHSQQH